MKLGTHVAYIIPKQVNLAIVPRQITPGRLWWPFSKMATISETKRRRTFNFYSIYRFCEAYISEKVLPNVPHHSIRHCERHFTKWRPFPKYYGLSQKLRGAERSMLTLCIGYVGRRFQKNYCQMYHTILSDIVNAI